MRLITRDVSIPKLKLIKLTCYLCEMLSHDLTGLIIMIKVEKKVAELFITSLSFVHLVVVFMTNWILLL